MENNILRFSDRQGFREWLSLNVDKEKECYILIRHGKPEDDGYLYYLDAVEEALCFGWIDSVERKLNGEIIRRFSPRKMNSPWTELNKERARRLIKLGMMTPSGYKVLPPLGKRSFKIDEDVKTALKEKRCFSKFRSFPELYQRIRAYNVTFYKKRDPKTYDKALTHLVEETAKGRMYGEWNDYGRLLDY